MPTRAVNLTFGASYTTKMLLSAFEGTPETFCDGTFVRLKENILCFFEEGSVSFPTAESVIWRPPGKDLEPTDDGWFPRAIRRGTYHLFLKDASDLHEYLGVMRLTSAGGYPGDVSVSFNFEEKLPLENWIRLGGYPGWLIVANHKKAIIPEGDVGAFDMLLAKAEKRKRLHLALTRYRGDSLEVFFNPSRAWVMYLPSPEHSGLYFKPTNEDDEEEVFSCTCGIDLEFARHHTTDHETAFQVARSYVAKGKIPDFVEWTDDLP